MRNHSSFFPIRKRVGTFSSLALTSPIMALSPHIQSLNDLGKPKRKSLDAPKDNNTFVKPIKQSFIKNPRLMPMTRIMLTLLSGWGGQGGTIETTIGIIAKHLSRCRRQVFRYLKDAAEEGYLFYSRTKDRIGRYTGIKVWINFPAIRFTRFSKRKTECKTAETLDMTLKSETNGKYIYRKEEDSQLRDVLERFAAKSGLSLPEMAPI